MRFVTLLLLAPGALAYTAPSACHASRAGGLRSRNRARMTEVVIDLGEGYGMVAADFTPMFAGSEFVVARFAVPFNLNVEPQNGLVVVTKSDDQLKEGDVVRATSTFSMRMDTTFGLLPAAKKVKALFDVTGKDWTQVVEVRARPTRARAMRCLGAGASDCAHRAR